MSPYISTEDPPNEGPVDGEILVITGAEDINDMSELDSSDIEEQYNDTWTDPTSLIAIQQVARDGLVNVAGEADTNEPDWLVNLQT